MSRDRGLEFNANIILDIDEDFFGCENVADHISQRGIYWKTIELIDERVAQFLCPRDSIEEAISDKILRMRLFVLLPITDCRHGTATVRCNGSFKKALKIAEKQVLDDYKINSKLFCGKNIREVKATWRLVISTFNQLSIRSMRYLINIGFCLNEAPTTFGSLNRKKNEKIVRDTNPRFVLCHGANEPNSSYVFVHTPSRSEMNLRMKTFKGLVSMIRPLPRIVSLCRSVRDGYTPRALAADIEQGVLSALMQQNTERYHYEPEYDLDLLGAKIGWNSRPNLFDGHSMVENIMDRLANEI